jgi:hypothetical protein
MPLLGLQPFLPVEGGSGLSPVQKTWLFRFLREMEAKNLPVCTCYVKHYPRALSRQRFADIHCTALRNMEKVLTGQALLSGNQGLATVLFVKNHKEYISNVNFS